MRSAGPPTVVDIEVQALEGAAQTGKIVDALAAGDKVDANDHPFGTTFPYVALPNAAGVNTGGHGPGAAPAAMTGGVDAPAQPAAYKRASSGTPIVVATVSAGLAAVTTVVLLFLVGWWRRRTKLLPAVGPTDKTVQL